MPLDDNSSIFPCPLMKPWVGPYYSAQPFNKIKLLILGESEYEWEPGCLTQDIASKLISGIAKGDWTHKFYSNIFRVLTGRYRREAGADAYQSFWHSISFYNFVQDSVGPKPRYRPNERTWRNGLEYFKPVISQLSPQAILVLGKALWGHLSSIGVVQASPDAKCFIAIDGIAPIPSSFICHPSSSRYKYSVWRPILEQWLSYLRAKQG